MTNVVTMGGHALRTPADVVNDLNEALAAGAIKDILVVTTKPNNHRDIDWSNQSMADFVFSCTTVQHNMLVKLGEVSATYE